ncbi:unnamed protein product [Phytophthora fragariaefolia]|uniref:Unnamed protein product n=1 Tax=Phytophthora fragariaefolia TaxID=1490495 RepID=A0A9W6TW09_9STRA|nr:unnamed protein product [Phytophthora fragariaefolia]
MSPLLLLGALGEVLESYINWERQAQSGEDARAVQDHNYEPYRCNGEVYNVHKHQGRTIYPPHSRLEVSTYLASARRYSPPQSGGGGEERYRLSRQREALQAFTARRMKCIALVLLFAGWVMIAQASREDNLRRALGELAASAKQKAVTGQDLLEGPPEIITSLPLFKQLVREERRELLSQIGELHLFGDGSVPHNTTHAELFLQESADSYGSAQAQFLLGVLRASSDDDDNAAAYLYYEFAAHGGSIGASMALGYRALHGYSSTKSCVTAMRHYKFAADRVVTEQSEQKLQLYAFPEPVRLSETEGARYHTDLNPAEDFHRAEYLRQRAGDFRNADLMVQSASITLFSDLYRTAGVTSTEEHAVRERQALRFLERSIEMGSIKAQALMGHVHAHGLAGSYPNVTKAVELYESALNASKAQPSGEAANGLGLVYSRGIGGVEVDLERARSLFKVAANAGHAEGVYNTGLAFLELGSYHTARAKEYFVAAAHVGHLKSIFQLARIKQRQIRTINSLTSPSASCEEVVELYKRVAEYSREGTTMMLRALAHSQRGNWALALELYLVAAEMGYEVAQSNAIWLIERVRRQVFGTASIRSSKLLDDLYTRLITRASTQDSTDALLRLGDRAFHDKDYSSALRYYQHADLVSAGTSAEALFSVGYMYEYGLGVSSISSERATLYYHLAGEKEPAVHMVMALLQLKLRALKGIKQVTDMLQSVVLLITQHSDDAGTSIDQISSSTMAQSVDEGTVSTSRDISGIDHHQNTYQRQVSTLEDSASLSDEDNDENVIASGMGVAISSDSYEYAAALQFVGAQSRLHLELLQGDLPLEQQDLTIETWLRVDDLPSANNRAEQVITLVDALDNFQLEIIPATGAAGDSSWILRFRKYSLVDKQFPELVLSFSHAPLLPHTWNHIAVTFDATFQTVTLMLNARIKQVLTFRPHPAAPSRSEWATSDGESSTSSKFLAIGSNLARIYGMKTPNSKVFSGQVVHFRLWKTRKTIKEVRLLMVEQYDDVATRDLLIHLRYDLRGTPISTSPDETNSDKKHSKSTPKRVMNRDQTVPEAHGIQLKIVEFPPPTDSV